MNLFISWRSAPYVLICFLKSDYGVTVVFKKTRWHARDQGIFEEYLGDIWRNFGRHVKDFLGTFAGQLEEIKRRLEMNNLVV